MFRVVTADFEDLRNYKTAIFVKCSNIMHPNRVPNKCDKIIVILISENIYNIKNGV